MYRIECTFTSPDGNHGKSKLVNVDSLELAIEKADKAITYARLKNTAGVNENTYSVLDSGWGNCERTLTITMKNGDVLKYHFTVEKVV